MAAIDQNPVPSSPVAAAAALDEHLSKVLRGRTLEEAGWRRPDPLTLLIQVEAVRPDGQRDPYLLRLHFGYYPEWPPSTLFVNPATGRYDFLEDLGWLPSVSSSNEIAVHANYAPIGQLVCASVTLEFYLVRHGVEARHLWDSARQNFAATLNAVERALRAPLYIGPQGPR